MTTDAELNRQFPLAIDLNKTLPDLLKLRTKAGSLMYNFKHLSILEGQSDSLLLINWLILLQF